jgi:hypothetical protein
LKATPLLQGSTRSAISWKKNARRYRLARLFMTAIQKFLMAVLPKGLAAEIRAESERWQIRCETCGNARSVWDAGGLRWKAAAVGKRIMVVCPQCGVMRSSTLAYIASASTSRK